MNTEEGHDAVLLVDTKSKQWSFNKNTLEEFYFSLDGKLL